MTIDFPSAQPNAIDLITFQTIAELFIFLSAFLLTYLSVSIANGVDLGVAVGSAAPIDLHVRLRLSNAVAHFAAARTIDERFALACTTVRLANL